MVQRAVFQSVASMGLPAFTIHSIVKYSGKALKDAKNKNIRTYGPIGVCLLLAIQLLDASDTSLEQLGLAAVPFLPFLFDKPVEEAVEWTFHKAFKTIGGPDAVSHRPETGRVKEMLEESRKGASKEKEL